jgi:hypothetical protein
MYTSLLSVLTHGCVMIYKAILQAYVLMFGDNSASSDIPRLSPLALPPLQGGQAGLL